MHFAKTIGLVVGIGALVALSPAADAAEVTLKTQTALPKQHDLSKSFLEEFVAKLNNQGKGVIQIEYLGGPEVNPPQKAANAVQRGVIDLLHTPAAYHAGIVPQGGTLMATTLSPSEYRANGTFAMIAPNWEKKLNAKILAIGETSGQFYLYLTKEPKLKDGVIDLTGMKIRTTGAYRPLIQALGGTPVQITNAGEVYTALERGTVDGFGWPTVGLGALGLGKLVKYRIDPPFYHLANVLLINMDKWKSLPKPAQDLLLKVGAEYEKSSRDYMDAAAKRDAAVLEKDGVKVYKMSPEGAKKYLQIAYDAMWKRASSRLDKDEAKTLRAKLYKEN